jgi:hypothetical protein
MTYDEAIRALYQAPHGEFVAERKRLSTELTKAGHKSEAALLSKHARPSVSAWVVNQLWSHDETAMKALFASGARVRSGELSAVAAHRQTTAELVTQAGALLAEAGHSTSEATLRKVSANLAALAVAGGFEPDPPGALRSDRDPPGFESMALVAEHGKAEPARSDDSDRTRVAAAERARVATAEAERRANEARQRALAERARFIAELTEAQSNLDHLERKRNEQQSALAATKAELANVRARVAVLQAEVRMRSENTEEPEPS